MSTTVPPLTTTFTPAPTCLSDYYVWNATNFAPCVVGESTQTCKIKNLGPPITSACLPSSYDPITTAYYSPGVCPSEYATACSSVVSIGTATETRATCCPSGYICQTETGPWPWYPDHACTYGPSNVETFVYTSSVSNGWYTGTTRDYKAANAYGIAVRWQSTDFTITSTADITSSTATATTTGERQPSDTSARTDFRASHGTTSGSGLSVGTTAGIGVGAALGAIILVLAAFIAYRMYWKPRRKAALIASSGGVEGPAGPSRHHMGASELQAEEVSGMYAGPVVVSKPAVELPVEDEHGISSVRGDRYA